jgi:oligopeptide transport system substrate-binding protein
MTAIRWDKMLPLRSVHITARLAPLLLALALPACSEEGSGPVVVSVVGQREEFARPLQNLPAPGAKLYLESTAQGLVAFDAAGDILPALAQRWIVEDEGRSYIFRLRRASWANGSRVTASDVARMLDMRIEAQRRLDPDGPFNAVDTVKAMTGEVIEIRLLVARPQILQLLAQPQMAVLSRDGGTGPYRAERRPGALFLTPVDPQPIPDGEDEAPPTPSWQMRVLRAERSALAIVRFKAEGAALVLGGRFSDLPLLTAAGIDRDRVRVDPVQGLLGLGVEGDSALLADPAVREAISMAIDRSQLQQLFPLAGWTTTDQLLPIQLDLAAPPIRTPWADLPLDQRRTEARSRITRWQAAHDPAEPVRIALPSGPGATLLFGMLRRDLGAIGLAAERVDIAEKKADLRLIDEVAAYDSALWYLGRIGCARGFLCSDAAEALLREGRLDEAVAQAQAHAGYIPLGAPIRWSLVSQRLTGFTPSPRARHPLNHLFRSTN